MLPASWMEALARNLRWQDAVDVALLTLLFSAIYRVMRRTVALQVGLGLVVLAGGWWLAKRYGLILTSYVLSALSAVGAIVVVVVFQHEIRLALVRANPLRWLARRRPSLDTRRMVAEAAFAIARHGKGALIVLPGRDPIVEHATSRGTPLDARLSASLLEAIFTSASPLHDGAVVVRQDRVLRAGLVLPLAAEGAAREHGTRHRAALGITALTDALVVVVSEESQAVSVVHDGRLGVATDPEALVEALRRAELPRRARGLWRRLEIARLLPYAAIFVAVSAGWGLLALDRSHVVARSVPLEMRGLGERLAFEPMRATTVTLELRSSGHELESLPADVVRAYVDLTRASLGLQRYPVRTEAPAGIEVASVRPPSVELHIRPRLSEGSREKHP